MSEPTGSTVTELIDLAEVRDGQAIVAYNRTEAALAVLRAKYEGATYDLTTTAGDKAARAARLDLKTLRTDLEAKRKELKAPALEFGKKIDAEAARLTGEILQLEQPIDAQIKADEERRAEEKRKREEAEAARRKVHTDGIAKLAGYVGQAADLPAARIAAGITYLEGLDLSGFEEFTAEATETRNRSVEALRVLHGKAVAREAEEERLKAERAEQERVRQEQEAQAKVLREQQEALDRQRRELEAREEAARAQAQEAQRQQAAAEIEQERQAEIQRRREEANAAGSAAMQAIDAAREAEDLPPQLLDAMEQAATGIITDLAIHHAAEAAKPATSPAVIPLPTRAPAAAPSAPTLRLGEINKRLAPLSITADGLASLGFPVVAKEGATKLWREEQWPAICDAITQRIAAAREQRQVA